MRLSTRLIVSLVIAIITATLTYALLDNDFVSQRTLLLITFFIATAATSLIVGRSADSNHRDTEKQTKMPASASATRQHGTVKWFNVSKGFGFIVKNDGEEIFVHFRSIRGEGRRSLRDGQSVSFIVAQSDKGPQAEDVVGED
jgi:cold shock protein